MGRTPAEKNYFTFNTGLITEGSKLTYVPNSLSDMSNFVIKPNKWIERRRGLDYEINNSVLGNTAGVGDYWIEEGNMPSESPQYRGAFSWKSADGQHGQDYYLIALQDIILVYRMGSPPLSGGLVSFIRYGSGGFVTFAATGPWLVMVSDNEDSPVALNINRTPLDASGDEVFPTAVKIQIRDFGIVTDGIPPGARPVMSASDIDTQWDTPMAGFPDYTYGEYKYDLVNAGWSKDTINAFRSTIGSLPAKGDVYGIGVVGEAFKPGMFKTSYAGPPTGTSVRGRMIVDALRPSREAAIQTIGMEAGTLPSPEPDRIFCTATYAGRIWYAGKSNRIYYTVQLNDFGSLHALGRCYQEQDPSAVDFSDLLATDGGYIPITGAGNFKFLEPYGDSLIAFNSGGVWEISGSQGMMNAEDISVRKLSSVEIVGRDSVVNAEDALYFWGESAIYTVRRDEYGNVRVDNISDTTIYSMFTETTFLGKQEARGVYDPKEKVVYWFYNKSLNETDTLDAAAAREVLCFDTRIGAYYPFSISTAEAPNWPPAPPPPGQTDPPPVCNGELVPNYPPKINTGYVGHQRVERVPVINNQTGFTNASVVNVNYETTTGYTGMSTLAPSLTLPFTGERVIEAQLDYSFTSYRNKGAKFDQMRLVLETTDKAKRVFLYASPFRSTTYGLEVYYGRQGQGDTRIRSLGTLPRNQIWGFSVDGTNGDARIYMNGASITDGPLVEGLFAPGDEVRLRFEAIGFLPYANKLSDVSDAVYLNTTFTYVLRVAYSAQKFLTGYATGTTSWCGNEDAGSTNPSNPFPQVPPFIMAPIMEPPTTSAGGDVMVYVGQDEVYVDDDQVVLTRSAEKEALVRAKVLVYVPLELGYGITVSEFNSDTLTDWHSYNGIGAEYESYAEFGYETLDDPKRNKEARNVHLWFKPTESGVYEVTPDSGVMDYKTPSACRLISKWNWATSDVTNMWNDYGDVYQFPVYYSPDIGQTEFTLPYEVIPVQRELIGSGQSVTLRVESEPGMELTLVGWAALYTAENNP